MKDQRTGRIGRERYPLLLQMIEQRMTSAQIADALGVNQETVRKFARCRGLSVQPVPMSLEHHPSWTGGRTKDRSGYLLQRVPKDGEFGYLIRAITKRAKSGEDPNGYAPVHRIVAHQKIGRPLLPGEVVDHIDGDVTNNHPDNLRVFPSNAEHLRVTLKGRRPKWTPEGMARMTGRPKKRLPEQTQP